MNGSPVRHPGVLTLIGVISLIWAGSTLVGSVLVGALVLLGGVASWLAGPVVGAMGSFIGLAVIGFLILASCLSILLFFAGVNTLRDRPSGIRMHRQWAWISIALDVIALLVSAGTSPTNWGGLVYAITVLYVTSLPEVKAYYGLDGMLKPRAGGAWNDEAF